MEFGEGRKAEGRDWKQIKYQTVMEDVGLTVKVKPSLGKRCSNSFKQKELMISLLPINQIILPFQHAPFPIPWRFHTEEPSSQIWLNEQISKALWCSRFRVKGQRYIHHLPPVPIHIYEWNCSNFSDQISVGMKFNLWQSISSSLNLSRSNYSWWLLVLVLV